VGGRTTLSVLERVKNKISYTINVNDHNIVKLVSGKKMDLFQLKNMRFSKKSETYEELEGLNSIYDVFVCGSDQIWNPMNYDPHYFLDFVKNTNAIIAYAPSFGCLDIENQRIRKEIEVLTKRFSYLSVREESGASILRSLGEDPLVVLDPTLLLSKDEWLRCANKNGEGERYLLVYFLRYNPDYIKQSYSIAQKLGLKVKIIPVVKGDLKDQNAILEGVGIDDFLALFNNASYICTDSFHGTIFSLIFNKQFTVFKRFNNNEKGNQNTRIENLLHEVNLMERLSEYNNYMSEIDYNTVNRKVADLRQKSLDFIHDSFCNARDNYS
jgi:hypothetical protein